MDIETARKLIERELTKDRYEHTLRVTQTAIDLANRFHVDEEKVKLAALLHDLAKCMPRETLQEHISEYQLPSHLLAYHHEVWHGPVAAKIVENEYHIKDEEVLHAIYYHTTGREKMSNVELVVFVADYIEPGRSFPGVDDVRNLAKTDLLMAAHRAVKNTIQYLLTKNAAIFPDTFYAYNDLTKKLGVNVD